MYGDIRSIDNASRPKPTGRQILAASWQMLKEDQQLLWVPVISAAASLAAGAALAGFGASTIAIYFQAALVIGAYLFATLMETR